MPVEENKSERELYLEGEVERQGRQINELMNESSSLNLKLTRQGIDLWRAAERIAWLTRVSDEDKKDATQARVDRYQVLYGQWGYNEALRRMNPTERDKFQEQIIVSNFLAGVGLSPERLGSMYPARQEETVGFLRKMTAKAFLGPHSWNPNTQAFTAIMKFINIYDPRQGRNQLLPKNP